MLAGTISVPSGANAYLGLNNSGGANLNVTSIVTGSGTLNVGITGNGLGSESLNLTGDLSAFTGTVNVYTGGAFSLASPMENGALAFTSTAGTFALNGSLDVGALTVAGNTVARGSYTAAQLNALTQSALFAGSGTLTVVPPSIQTSDGRLTVSVFRSGVYSVASSVTGWTFQGTLPNALTSLTTATGSDSIGAFQQISFSWLDAASRAMTGSINLYNGQDTLVFSDTLASQVTLHGYASVLPTAAVRSGSASTISYDAASGHFSVTITVSPGAPLNNDLDPARQVVVTFGTAFPNWQKTKFGANAGNPAIAGAGANPSGDGVPNLTKYALGLDPNVASQAGLPGVTLLGQDGNLQMEFRRNLSATDISFQVQVSTDLVNWTSIATLSAGSASWTTQNAMVTDNGGQVTVTETSSTPPAGGKQFIRLTDTQ